MKHKINVKKIVIYTIVSILAVILIIFGYFQFLAITIQKFDKKELEKYGKEIEDEKVISISKDGQMVADIEKLTTINQSFLTDNNELLNYEYQRKIYFVDMYVVTNTGMVIYGDTDKINLPVKSDELKGIVSEIEAEEYSDLVDKDLLYKYQNSTCNVYVMKNGSILVIERKHK